MHWARPPPSGFPPPPWREPGAFEPLYAGFPQGLGNVAELGAVMAGGPAYDVEMDAQAALAAEDGGHPGGYHGYHGPHAFHDYHAHHGGPAGHTPSTATWQRHGGEAALRDSVRILRRHDVLGILQPAVLLSDAEQLSQMPNAKRLTAPRGTCPGMDYLGMMDDDDDDAYSDEDDGELDEEEEEVDDFDDEDDGAW